MQALRLLPFLALAVACGSQPVRPATAPGPLGPLGAGGAPQRIVAPDVPTIDGLPHAVKTGLTVQIAGMVPVDSAGRLVAAGDLAGQARQVLKNLVAVVRAARGVPGDVVQLTVYLRDPSPASVLVVRTALLEALGKDTPPALTVVGTTGLPEAAMQIMVNGVAQLRSEFPDRTRMRP